MKETYITETVYSAILIETIRVPSEKDILPCHKYYSTVESMI